MKITYIILFLGLIGLMSSRQAQGNLTIWIQAISVLLFFYGLMRLMSKTPGNNKNKNDNDAA